MTPEQLVERWRADAQTLRQWGAEVEAHVVERCADELSRARQTQDDAVLTLAEAAARSGYSEGHLGRLVRRNKIPNAGKLGSPRIRVIHLPTRLSAVVAERRPKAYDVATDARSLLNRRKGGAYGSSQDPS